MAPKTTGAATDPTPVATAPAEPTAPTAETAGQKIEAQLKELQDKLSEFQNSQAKLEKEKNDAVAQALRNEAMYKGLQNQTTKTFQQAAEDRKKLEQYENDRAELAEIKEMLSTVASRVLSEEENKELQYKQRELQLKLKEQALAAAAQSAVQAAAQPVASPQYSNPEDEKAQFLNYYFPDSKIDPKDPNIDWGEGATSTQEAFRRFTTSVIKIKDGLESARTQDAMAAIKQQTTDALAAFKAEQETLATTTAAEIAKAKEDAINQARKDSEKKLRALGADVPGTPPPDAGGNKTWGSIMNEELDDTLLRTPKGTQEYNRRLEAIKARMRGR